MDVKAMKTYSDNELIKQCKEKNEEAFNELFKRYYPVAYKLAFHICKSEADAKDAAQDAMISVYRNISSLKQSEYFSLWLKRIVVGKCNRIFRKNNHVTYIDDESLLMKHYVDKVKEHNPFQQIHFHSDQEVLAFFIAMLPDAQKEVLQLFYLKQQSIKEIANMLSCSEGTVKSRMYMGKKKLREQIKAYESREEIHLDFQSDALYAMLYSSSLFGLIHKQNLSPLFTSSKLCACLFMIASIAGLGAAYEMQQSHKRDDIINNTIQKETKVAYEFPEIQLHDRRIDNAQDAYFRILMIADKEETIPYLKAEHKEDIADLLKALKSYGGVYYEHLNKYEFIKDFK